MAAVTLAAVVRMHDAHEIAALVIDSLLSLCDWVAVQLNNPTAELLAVLKDVPGIAETACFREPYRDHESLNRMVAMCGRVRPRWCLLSDQDEIYPPNLRAVLDKADSRGMWAVRFPTITPVGTVDNIIARVAADRLGPHAKAFRWGPRLKFGPRLSYHRVDDAEYRRRTMVSAYPLRHCAFLLPSMVERRKTKIARAWEWFVRGRPWRTVPFDARKTYREWLGGPHLAPEQQARDAQNPLRATGPRGAPAHSRPGKPEGPGGQAGHVP